MNKIRFQGLCLRYPWLPKLGEGVTEANISISRLSREVLETVPVDEHWDGELGSSGDSTRYWIAGEDGYPVALEVRGEGEHGSNYAHSSSRHFTGESVINALCRAFVGGTPPTKFILASWQEAWSSWDGSQQWQTSEIIIYLPQVDVASVLAEAEAKADLAIEAEIASALGLPQN